MGASSECLHCCIVLLFKRSFCPILEFYCFCCKLKFEYQSKYDRHLKSESHLFKTKIFNEVVSKEVLGSHHNVVSSSCLEKK